MVRRVARGWVIENARGRVVAGPYYSLSYAQDREKELNDQQRRFERLRKQRDRC